jgi:CspA family cold shock protein
MHFSKEVGFMSQMRTEGTVSWFSRAKGYGFIQPDNQEEDVFVHYSAIEGEGYRNLKKGQRVEFSIEDTPKGPQALDVKGLSVESDPSEDLSSDVSDEVSYDLSDDLSDESWID